MSKIAALMLVLVLLTAQCTVATTPVWASTDQAEDSWASKAPMQEARCGLGVVVVNGKIYAIGGATKSSYGAIASGMVGTNEEYDPATDTWAFKEPMPTPRARFAIAAYQGKIYCIGGTTGYSSDTGRERTGVNEVYDPETDTWETKAAMPTARSSVHANVVNGKIYLIGGYPNGTLNEVYDPVANTWETKMSMPTEEGGYASAVVDNKIYIFWATLNQIYDSVTDSWSQGASPPRDILGVAVATTGALAPTRIYVLTSPVYIGSGPQSPCRVEVYNPASDEWTTAANITTTRAYFGAAIVNDKVYAIGGAIYNYLGGGTTSAVNEQYTPIGYGTPDPAPSPSPSSSPSPSPSASPSPSSSNQQPELIYAAAAAVTTIIITAIALKKKHKLTRKALQINKLLSRQNFQVRLETAN